MTPIQSIQMVLKMRQSYQQQLRHIRLVIPLNYRIHPASQPYFSSFHLISYQHFIPCHPKVLLVIWYSKKKLNFSRRNLEGVPDSGAVAGTVRDITQLTYCSRSDSTNPSFCTTKNGKGCRFWLAVMETKVKWLLWLTLFKRRICTQNYVLYSFEH